MIKSTTLLKKSALFLPVIIMAACTNAHKAGNTNPVNLAHKSIKGENYSITTTIAEKISSTDSTGNSQVQENNMESEINYTVADVDTRGVATINGKYASLKWGNFDSKKININSDTAMVNYYNLIAQNQISMWVDTMGHVKKVTGAQGLYSMGIKDSPMDDNKILQETVNNALTIFPGKTVKKGDTWETKNKINYGYPGIYKNTYTLKDIVNGKATIEISSQITPNLLAPPTYFPGNISIRMELNGSQTGTIHVDIEKGKIMATDQTLRLSGKSMGTMAGKPFENIMSVEMTTKTKLKPGKP